MCTQVRRWPPLFSLAGEPAALLEQCFVSGRWRTAVYLLVILQEMWGFISSTPHSLLVEAALACGEIDLATEPQAPSSWAVLKMRTLLEAPVPAESPGLLQAIRAPRARPMLLRLCAEEVGSARRASLVERSVQEVTKSGPGGIPPPIELHAHDPMRCLLYTSPSPRDQRGSRMPSSA